MLKRDSSRAYPWPRGARCVVAMTFDWDGACVEIDEGQIPLGAFSHGRYSAKRGIPRYLKLLERKGIKGTFFVPGYDAEGNPDLLRQIAAAGHEVAAHGYMHEGKPLGDAEPKMLRKTHDILIGICGSAPRGWRSPSGQKTSTTIRTLRELGYVYDSSDKDHDFPYMCRVGGQELSDYVSLPNNTSSLDDYPFFDRAFTPASEVLQHWKQEFDAIYHEAGYFNLIIHPRTGYGSGSPARARIVDQLIDYMRGFEGVEFVRLIDLAEWCISHASAFSQIRRSAHV